MALNTHSTTLVNSSDQYFTRSNANVPNLKFTNDMTLEFDIKLTATASSVDDHFAIVFMRDSEANRAGYQAYILKTDNKLYFRWYSGANGSSSSYAFTNAAPFSVDTWAHASIAFDESANDCEFTVNGSIVASTQVGSTVTALGAATTDFYAFAVGGGASWHPSAELDNLRLWTGLRTEAQVDANKELQLTSETNLELSMLFNNNALDSSNNGYDLTPINSPTYTSDVPFPGSPDPSGFSPKSIIYY